MRAPLSSKKATAISQVVDPSRCRSEVREERIVSSRYKLLIDGSAGSNFAAQKVIGLVCNDLSHATARIGNVAFVARDDVQVKVGNRLTGRGVLVESDVESVWAEAFRYSGPTLIDGFHNRSLLDCSLGSATPGCDVWE